jgi:signal peptidase II
MDRRDVEHGQLPKAFSHIGTALALAALDLGVKAWAEHALADGRPVDLGLLQLRLLFNPGVAFSSATPLPAGVVLAVTGRMVAVLAVFAWQSAGTGSPWSGLAVAVILGGPSPTWPTAPPTGW